MTYVSTTPTPRSARSFAVIVSAAVPVATPRILTTVPARPSDPNASRSARTTPTTTTTAATTWNGWSDPGRSSPVRRTAGSGASATAVSCEEAGPCASRSQAARAVTSIAATAARWSATISGDHVHGANGANGRTSAQLSR